MSAQLSFEIAILAGGRSSRMGRDKAALSLGRRTLLGRILQTASSLGMPVRVVRKDIIAGQGPMGGIYTALKSARADAVLFLSCDMPFVSRELLLRTMRALSRRRLAVFVLQTQAAEAGERFARLRRKGARNAGACLRHVVGFPFVVRGEALPLVENALAEGVISLQDVAVLLKARLLKLPQPFQPELFNINTPADWAEARKQWAAQNQSPCLPEAQGAHRIRRRRRKVAAAERLPNRSV